MRKRWRRSACLHTVPDSNNFSLQHLRFLSGEKKISSLLLPILLPSLTSRVLHSYHSWALLKSPNKLESPPLPSINGRFLVSLSLAFFLLLTWQTVALVRPVFAVQVAVTHAARPDALPVVALELRLPALAVIWGAATENRAVRQRQRGERTTEKRSKGTRDNRRIR